MNILVNTPSGEEALINWDNVTSVTTLENYAKNQVGDSGSNLEFTFVNRRSVVVAGSLDEIKERVGGFK